MPFMKQPYQWVVVIGRTWYRRNIGGTYSSASVYIDTKFIGKAVGYGNDVTEAALQVLITNGWVQDDKVYLPSGISKVSHDFYEERIANREKWTTITVEVVREKDL